MDENHERVVDCTTPKFNGIISVMDPTRNLRIGRFVPGCYTLAVSEPLPEDLQVEVDMVYHRELYLLENAGITLVDNGLHVLRKECLQALCEEERVQYNPPKHV